MQFGIDRQSVGEGSRARIGGRDSCWTKSRRNHLVAVTKGVEVARIEEALELGIQDIGENRVQEAEAKLPQIERPCRDT